MLEKLKKLLFGPALTPEERRDAVMCTESLRGRKIFHLDGPAAEQFIKEYGFPMRESNGLRRPN